VEALKLSLATILGGSLVQILHAQHSNAPLDSQQELGSHMIVRAAPLVKHAQQVADLVIMESPRHSLVSLTVHSQAQPLHVKCKGALLGHLQAWV
jgi:hypothetical protein